MNHGNYGHPGNEGSDHLNVPRENRPYWKRAHHDWRFWVGMVLVFGAIAIYVMSDNLALMPLGRRPPPPSGTVGK